MLLAAIQLCMTYAPIMDAVLFLIRNNIVQVVSIRNSTFMRSYISIISNGCDGVQTLIGILIELRFPFVLQ